jgi:transposase-like protein
MSGKKGMVHYPLDVKLEAVRLFYEEGKTRGEIATILGLRNEGRVKEWVQSYRREGEMAFNQSSGRPRKVWDERARIKQLEMENALLKKYHTELRKSLLAKRNIGLSFTIEGTTK